MILLDVNILVHAYNVHSPNHHRISSWLKSTLAGSRPIGLSWVTILGFLRITTHRSIFKEPLQVQVVIRTIRAWLARVNAQPRHIEMPGVDA